jgi:hypothetical protein
MAFELEIFYLNKEHSKIINSYLDDVYSLVYDATFFTEDYEAFEDLIHGVVAYHNGLGDYVATGSVNRREWYISLPNNMYWCCKGFFANLQLYQEQEVQDYEQKLLSLTINVLDRLNTSIIASPLTEKEININLN